MAGQNKKGRIFMNIYQLPKEEVLKNAKIPMRVMETEAAMYEEMAEIMASCIENAKGEQVVFIVPVGPIWHYPVFAEKVNQRRISLKNCWFINMDEYLVGDDETVPYDNILSFHATMDRMLYSKIDPELIMPESQRLFPEPGNEAALDAMIASFPKIDLCLTGVGINGHLAFNEPPAPEENITDEEYFNLGTRCMNIARETIVNNGANKLRGALDIFPKRCITLGLKQLLRAEVFKVYLYCDWQWGIMRKITLGDVTRFAPASALQNHPNSEVVVTKALAEFEL